MGLLMLLLSARNFPRCACMAIALLTGISIADAGQRTPGTAAPQANTGQNNPPPHAAEPAPGSRQFPANTSGGPVDFESRGMHYEALTRDGITVMFASLPPRVKDYNIVQVTVTNGSPVSWTVKPSDFSFVRQDGTEFTSVSADDVVGSLLQRASRNDVIKLQVLYEDSIYALSNYRATNGYEQRREAAMAQFVNKSFAAAAAASAITLIPVKLRPGDSTDGAVFFENRSREKTLGIGRLIARTCGEIFSFQVFTGSKTR